MVMYCATQGAIILLLRNFSRSPYFIQHPGYNIGFNVGEAAGQTVMHCHCHVIPRYVRDVPDARGGVRGVVPGKRGD